MASEGSIEIDGFKLKYRTEGSEQDVVVIGCLTYYSRSFSQNLEKGAHSPHYEEAELIDAEILKWFEKT